MFDTPHDLQFEALTDEWTMNRLLAGDLAPDDLPAELGGIALLVRALTAPPEPAELAGMDTALSPTSATGIELEARRRARARARARRRRVASAVPAAALGVLVFGSSLAVANVLPTPAQRWASDVLAHVGVHADHRDDTASPASSESTSHGGSAVSGVASTPSTGPGKGAEVSGIASDGRSRATTPSTPGATDAPPASTPPVSSPRATPATPVPNGPPDTPPGLPPGTTPPTPSPPDPSPATPGAPESHASGTAFTARSL